MKDLLKRLVTQNWKAIAGFLSSVVLVYLARHGVSADMRVGDAVPLLSSGVVGACIVWLFPSNKDK